MCWKTLRNQSNYKLNEKWKSLIGYKKEDTGIEQQLYEIVRGKNFALNCLSWKFTEIVFGLLAVRITSVKFQRELLTAKF